MMPARGSIHHREFIVECFDPALGLWYFCARVFGIDNAITWSAAFRSVKGLPSRVVELYR